MPKRSAQPVAPPPPQMVEVIDPRWMAKAVGFTLLAALICGYLTLCLLFWQGQWQLVLHPSRTVKATPASLQLPFEDVRFGVDATGVPQLDGWWVPAAATTAQTALLLHTGDGALDAALPRVRTLHNAGLNVFAFDYRGFGASGGTKASQESMQQDAHSALDYVLKTRHVPPSQLAVYGIGVGGPLALQLCGSVTIECGVEIFEDARGDFREQVASDPRTRLVPTGLLFHEDFPLAAPLQASHSAKLLITTGSGTAPRFATQAADPKMLLELPSAQDPALLPSLQRFLSDFWPRS